MKSLFTIYMITLALSSYGQSVVPISLEKVLELGNASNLTIKQYQERQTLADAELSKAREWWLPNLTVGAQTHHRSGAVMNGNGKFYLDIDRNNLGLGLGLAVNWDIAEGIYSVSAAKLKRKAGQFLADAEHNVALLSIISSYYNLLTAQSTLAAYRNLVAQSESISQQIQIQVDAGLQYQSEALLAKSNQYHLKIMMLNAKNEYSKSSAELRSLLNLSQNVKLVSTDSILAPLEFEVEIEENTEESTQRAELMASQLEVEALKAKKKVFTTGLLFPDVNVGAQELYFGGFNGNVTPVDALAYPNPERFYNTGELNASVQWNIPLGALVYNGDNKKYKSLIRLKELESEQLESTIDMEVANARNQVMNYRDQIKIAKEALELTTEALDQSIQRQKLGTAKPFEVFQAQQFFLQSKIDYIQSIGRYNVSQYALKAARGEKL